MIINNRSDFDAAPAEQREQFMKRLALSIHKWRWNGSDWEQYENTDSIDRFGFTVADFPDAPVPAKPDYNPDERALEREADEVRTQRDALLVESDWAVLPDAPVADEQAWKDYRQALRDVPQQNGFPTDIDWPVKPE